MHYVLKFVEKFCPSKFFPKSTRYIEKLIKSFDFRKSDRYDNKLVSYGPLGGAAQRGESKRASRVI